jgi:hypothetical protein
MSRPQAYRVILRERRSYAFEVEAFDAAQAEELARDIYVYHGFTSGKMIELLSEAHYEIVSVSRSKIKESTHHG